jgi:hypothetical protein
LQQLGRGLRLSSGKPYLTALDFIGNYRRAEYKLPLLAGIEDPFVADVDRSGNQSAGALLQIFRNGEFRNILPAGCSVELDLKAIDLLAAAVAQQEPVRERLIAALKELAAGMHRRPTLLETDRHGLFPARQYRSVFRRWFRALGAAGMIEITEATLDKECGDFLEELEKTAMNRSYKMAVLQIWLSEEAFPKPLEITRLVSQWRRFFSETHYRRDIRDTEIAYIESTSDAVLRSYIERNPLHFWSQGDYFSYDIDEGCFTYVGPSCSDISALRAAVAERVGWRLHRYFERKFERRNVYALLPNGESKVCIMLGERPAPDTPAGSGWKVVFISGQRYYAKFAKIAVNVIKGDPNDSLDVPNRLTEILAAAFACPTDELAGKSVRIVRDAHDEAWSIEPEQTAR